MADDKSNDKEYEFQVKMAQIVRILEEAFEHDALTVTISRMNHKYDFSVTLFDKQKRRPLSTAFNIAIKKGDKHDAQIDSYEYKLNG